MSSGCGVGGKRGGRRSGSGVGAAMPAVEEGGRNERVRGCVGVVAAVRRRRGEDISVCVCNARNGRVDVYVSH